MDSKRFDKLQKYYHSLLEQSNIFNQVTNGKLIYPTSFIALDYELTNISKEYPDIIPPYNKEQYFVHSDSYQGPLYNFMGIQTYLASVIGRLRVELEQPINNPITEQKEFPFIDDIELRQIIQRDYIELQKAYIAGCWKSVILLSGGLIEAILLDLLKAKNEEDIKKCKSKPNESDITKWDLGSLIKVSVELKLISDGAEKLSNPIREYRNLIHPGNEIRKKLRFGPEEAKIAVEIVNMLHRDLTH